MTEQRTAGSYVLWIVFAVSVAATLLTLAGSRLVAPSEPPAGAGPTYPRVPTLPQSPTELLRLMRIGSLTWYASILSAPLFVLLSRRLRFERRRWLLSLTAFAAVVLLLAAGTVLVQHRLTYAGAPVAPPLGAYLLASIVTTVLPFIAVAATAQALAARARAHDRELDAARLKAQLSEARLEALTAQLQPHFLFNTLQGISTLIQHDAAAADRMLTQLSDLLREVLRRREHREVTLDEEVRVLRPYLDIARTRFGRRLGIRLDVDDAARHALVPFFVLQPLVENALDHGAAQRTGRATVTISASRADDRLRVRITDDGPGMDTAALQNGIGLPNTRARLAELYGDDWNIELLTPASGGLTVVIDLPFRPAPAAVRP